MNLTAQNTAIVLDSTADFPDAQEHYPNWRVVPLYVNFGTESYKDGVDLTAARVLRAPAHLARAADDVAADARRLPRRLRGARRVRADPLDPHRGESLRHVPERGHRRRGARRRPRAHDRLRDARPSRSRCSRLAIQRRLERGTTDEEVDALVERYLREHGLLFTVDTLEFLARGGRIGRGEGVRRPADEREADPLDPRRRGAAGEARARQPQGVPGVRRRARDADARRAGLRVGIAHADAPERMAELEKMVRDRRPQATIEMETVLGAVIGAHAGPGTVGFFWFADD